MNPELQAFIDSFFAEHQDEAYRAFQSSIVPTEGLARIRGVRAPQLHKLARTLGRRDDVGEFLAALPHTCFEENQVHAFIIGDLRDYERQMREAKRFVPYLDNWATCDQLSCKTFPTRPQETLDQVQMWIATEKTYQVRFGIGVLLQYFLDDLFEPEQLSLVAAVSSPEYYVNMMRSWYVAEALAKQPAHALDLVESMQLDRWTHNKAIQKARESRRVPPELKNRLKALRRP